MSYHVYFSMSTGLSQSLTVPRGTLERIQVNIDATERALDMQTPGGGSKWHWFNLRDAVKRASDKDLCRAAHLHNRFVRQLYQRPRDLEQNPADDVNGDD